MVPRKQLVSKDLVVQVLIYVALAAKVLTEVNSSGPDNLEQSYITIIRGQKLHYLWLEKFVFVGVAVNRVYVTVKFQATFPLVPFFGLRNVSLPAGARLVTSICGWEH